MKIAICGAGIAGCTLAHWLLAAGHEVTLIEQADALRTGGYVIDFWGVGYELAERMGILPRVLAAGYNDEMVKFVDARGHTRASFSSRVFEKALDGRFTSLPRGELVKAIFDSLPGRPEVLFGETLAAIEPQADGVRVRLRGGDERAFDAVVGADGQHSIVRRLAFGPDTAFERPLGCYVAACQVAGYRPREEAAYVSFTKPGSEVARFTLREDRTMLLFMFDAGLMVGTQPHDDASRKAVLRQVFADHGWETPQMLAALDRVDELYFDSMSQIVMPRWSSGRVGLVGDAAGCVSLLAGEGSGLAMAGAYVLAGELAAEAGNPQAAFARYEQRLRPLIEAKQRAARRFAFYFAPRTKLAIWLRNQAVKLIGLPIVGPALVARDLRDDFVLPTYGG